MKIYTQRSFFNEETKKHESNWTLVGNFISIRIEQEHCLEVGYDDEYTGGFTIVPVDAEKMKKDIEGTVVNCVPKWIAEEIKSTWRAARDAGGQTEAFRILERMVDRLGYGRTENNPSLAGGDTDG